MNLINIGNVVAVDKDKFEYMSKIELTNQGFKGFKANDLNTLCCQ